LRTSSSHFSQSSIEGFTLVELLMAIFLMAIIMTIVSATFFRSHEVIDIVRKQGEVYQMARTCMDRMLRDVTCAYVPAAFTAEPGFTKQEIAQYRFIGRHDKDGTLDKDSIYFTTTSDLGLGGHKDMITEVDYYLKEVEQGKGVYYLMRREDAKPHQDITTRGTEMELAEDVTALNIVYLDKTGTESEDWDIAKRLVLPSQVKITITFRRGDETYTFTGVASPPLSALQLKASGGKS